MGNKQSTTINQTIDICNENVVNLLSQTTNVANAIANSQQSLTLDFTGSTITCKQGISVSQVIGANIDLTAVFSTSNSNEMATVLQNAVQAASESENKSVSGFLAAKIADSQDNDTTIKQHLKNIIQQNIQSIVDNTCTAQVSTVQEGKIIMRDMTLYSDGQCNFDQLIQLRLAVNCSTNTVIQNVISDSVLNEAMIKSAAVNDSKAGGLEDVISAIGSILNVQTLLIVAVFIAFIVGGVFVVKFFFSSGGKISDLTGLKSTPKSVEPTSDTIF